jgi:hypothetical protein
MSYTAALTPRRGWVDLRGDRRGAGRHQPGAHARRGEGERRRGARRACAGDRDAGRVAGSGRPRRLALTPRPMRPPDRPVDVSAPMEGGRRARESRICREVDSTTDRPQIGARPKRRGRLVDADYATRAASLTEKVAICRQKVWRGPESNWRHHDFQSWIGLRLPGTAGGSRRRSTCTTDLSHLSRPAVRYRVTPRWCGLVDARWTSGSSLREGQRGCS